MSTSARPLGSDLADCLDGIRHPDQIDHDALEGIAAWLAAEQAEDFTRQETTR